MPSCRAIWLAFLASAVLASLPADVAAQSFNGAITGVVRDSTGGVVSETALTLRNLATDQTVATAISGAEGEYAFRNLAPGKYEVTAVKSGFQQVSLNDLVVPLGTQVRADVTLPVGGLQDRVEVSSGTSVLNTTATQEHGITPETLQQLPLLMNSGPRAAAGFAILMPGVSTGGGSNAFDARINGGLQSGDEATVDGVSMQQGFMSQGGMISIFQDFPMSPDMVSEVKVLTSNYAPEYGSSTSGQIMAVTRSGGSSFHGAGFIYHRDDSLKATQWGADSKPEFNRNNYGANIGGPAKVPGLWGEKVKSFFFFNHEGYRQTGGSNAPTLSIPSLRQRNGDFTDWRDSSGNLIPIYDPATLRPDGRGGFIKDQFMGCDGRTPNVICSSRINPIVRSWLDALPNPTSDGPLNNYLGPAIPDTILGNSDYYLGRYDLQFGSDHMFASFWHQRAPAKFVSVLPQSIASESYSDPQNSWVNRFNWDRTFTPNLLNHMSMGYLNRNEGYGSVNQDFVGDFPQIPGVAGYPVPPQISFGDGYAQFGSNAGINTGNVTTRPTFIINDMVTLTRGAHTFKAGMEFRKIMGNLHQGGNQAGTFNFQRGATGLVGVNSGSPIASFLLGAVDNGNATFRSVSSFYPRQHAWILHAGDTWRVNNRLTLDYGLRWDYYSPSSEKYDRFSFFDPIGANPGAGGRAGRLAFAGDSYGEASYGARYPEEEFYGGFAPRLGAVYSLNDKTVLRSGWGIFYTQAHYPGWGGGISLDGFSNTPGFSSTLGGIQPAFYLDQGLPQNFQEPPDIRSDYRNGQGILYRPLDANERPYAHQWNISVDRELGANLALSVAYVGSAGRQLPSSIEPLNAIDPAFLSLGDRLNDEFQPGMTSLNGVPLPYPGWVEQMTGCAPSVAQALRPYPQVLRQPAGPEREQGDVALQLAAGEAREAVLGQHLRAGVLHAVEVDLERVGQHAARSGHLERPAGHHLAVRARTERGDRRHRYAARAVGRLRLPAAVRRGQAMGQHRRPRQRARRRLADEHDLPLLVRACRSTSDRASATCRDSSALAASPRSSTPTRSSPRTRATSIRPGDRCSTPPRSSRWRRSTTTTAAATVSRKRCAASAITTRISRSSRTRSCRATPTSSSGWKPSTSGTGTSSAIPPETPGQGLAFTNDLASPDFGRWNGFVTDPRSIQLAFRFEF